LYVGDDVPIDLLVDECDYWQIPLGEAQRMRLQPNWRDGDRLAEISRARAVENADKALFTITCLAQESCAEAAGLGCHTVRIDFPKTTSYKRCTGGADGSCFNANLVDCAVTGAPSVFRHCNHFSTYLEG
jgi:hypothetical protein